MKSIVQRVERAAVHVEGRCVGQIGAGVVVFVGVEVGDSAADAHITARKLAGMRIFPGETPMDRCLLDVGGAALIISQFTLAGRVSKGRRPSFNRAERPERAEPLYMEVVGELRARGIEVATGTFGAHMRIEMMHDGPVSLRIETDAGVIIS